MHDELAMSSFTLMHLNRVNHQMIQHINSLISEVGEGQRKLEEEKQSLLRKFVALVRLMHSQRKKKQTAERGPILGQ